MMHSVMAVTLPDAYEQSLKCLLFELENGRSDVNGFIDCSMTIEVLRPFEEPRISRFFPGGAYDLERYRQEIVDGIFDFEVEAGNWHYTYHDRFNRWIDECVIPELKRDSGSRRAAISVRDNWSDAGSENPACLQHMQFFIRDGKLDMMVLFRSNDAVRAAYMNMFALTELQKTVADKLGIEVGRYYHTANSYHCYPDTASVQTLLKYCYRIDTKQFGSETTYMYDGFFDNLMAAERPAIAELVADLRAKEGV